jgi:hypothetical protein
MFELANEGAAEPNTLADVICSQRQFKECTCIAGCSTDVCAVGDGAVLGVSETAGRDRHSLMSEIITAYRKIRSESLCFPGSHY